MNFILIGAFNSTSRYLDDFFNIDTPYFKKTVIKIYPAVLLLVFIHCLLPLPLFVGVLCLVLFCYAVLYFCFAINLLGERDRERERA